MEKTEREREGGRERVGSGCVLLNDVFVLSRKSNLIHEPNQLKMSRNSSTSTKDKSMSPSLCNPKHRNRELDGHSN